MLSRRCGQMLPIGRPCSAPPMRDARFCFWHNPASEDDVAEARRLGGIRRRRERAVAGAYELAGARTVDGLFRVLEIAMIDAMAHRMALSWQGEQLDHPARSAEELAGITRPVLLTKGTTTADWLKRLVDVLGERLPNASVVELEGDHAHHIESIDAFLGSLEAHLTLTEEARIG